MDLRKWKNFVSEPEEQTNRIQKRKKGSMSVWPPFKVKLMSKNFVGVDLLNVGEDT